jgi:hypothetical protein
MDPLPPVPITVASGVANAVEHDLGPAARERFLAGAAVFTGMIVLITYVAALSGNHLAQAYLDAAGAPLLAFVAGWLGVNSPFRQSRG